MGFSPASETLASGLLPHAIATIYERESIPNLKASTPFLRCFKQKPMPERGGNSIRFYSYALLGANTNQAAEGTVGSPIGESSTTITATIGQLTHLGYIN